MTKLFRVLVTGTRRGRIDVTALRERLEKLQQEHGRVLLIEGGAAGADSEARACARYLKLDRACFPANWEGRGKAAGPFRNQLMLDVCKPDLVIALPGMNSVGTWDMIRSADRAGVKVEIMVQLQTTRDA